MHCPKCLSDKFVKSGFTKEKQRYKCKKCGCHFTQSRKKGATLETKILALKRYLEGMGFRAIGRLLRVSNVTVLYWIRTFGTSVKAHVNANFPDDARHIDYVEMDEMWHFTSKKKGSFGSGLLSIDIPKVCLDSQSEAEEKKPTKSSSIKSKNTA